MRHVRRLDSRLSLLLAAMMGCWLISILFVFSLVVRERSEKEESLLREQIVSRIKAEKPRILDDVLLGHSDGLRLSIKQIFEELGLDGLRLEAKGHVPIWLGEEISRWERLRPGDFVESTTVEFNGDTYGQLSALKRTRQSSDLWIAAGAVAAAASVLLLAIFFVVRKFISSQVVAPIYGMVESFSPDPMAAQVAPPDVYEHRLLYDRLVELKQRILGLQSDAMRQEKAAVLGRLAAQVAHDIRSPLAAIDVVARNSSGLPEDERRIIRTASTRLRDIANQLLSRYRDSSNQSGAQERSSTGASPILVSSVIDSIVSEKRAQYRSRHNLSIDFHLSTQTYGLFVDAPSVELQRVVSNLVNNSVEAIGDRPGKVDVSLRLVDCFVYLDIVDDGPGISSEWISKLMDRSLISSKSGGHGLGLSHALQACQRWGGELRIESGVGRGTVISLSVPVASPPSWFVPRINLGKLQRVAIVDDEPSVHELWRNRFRERAVNHLVDGPIHFSSTSELLIWASGSLPPDLCLIDFEFSDFSDDGLAVIQRLGWESRSILVTSRFEESAIVEACLARGIRMLPKSMIPFVPLS